MKQQPIRIDPNPEAIMANLAYCSLLLRMYPMDKQVRTEVRQYIALARRVRCVD